MIGANWGGGHVFESGNHVFVIWSQVLDILRQIFVI